MKRRVSGEFVRGVSGFRHAIGDPNFQPEKNRYHLFVALNCPWCHRASLARNILGLQSSITMDVVFPSRTETDDRAGPNLWQFAPERVAIATGAPLPECTLETATEKSYRLIKEIYAAEGLKGFYKGLSATIMKQASNQGLRFFWFNEYKNRVTSDGKKKMTPMLSLFGGMSAGIFSTLGNNPFDVVKTRMQSLDAHKYNGTMNCFYKILTQEGPKSFYKGCLARMGRVVPGQGVVFMSVEFIEQKISKYL